MTAEQRCTRLSMQAKRLREAADRIESLLSVTAMHTDELRAEAVFIQQVGHAIEVLSPTPSGEPS